ncbi:WRKY domain-containing protein [Psidium guajava]|nr:WRKY domain-containing protein [Psidium guajava]
MEGWLTARDKWLGLIRGCCRRSSTRSGRLGQRGRRWRPARVLVLAANMASRASRARALGLPATSEQLQARHLVAMATNRQECLEHGCSSSTRGHGRSSLNLAAIGKIASAVNP